MVLHESSVPLSVAFSKLGSVTCWYSVLSPVHRSIFALTDLSGAVFCRLLVLFILKVVLVGSRLFLFALLDIQTMWRTFIHRPGDISCAVYTFKT